VTAATGRPLRLRDILRQLQAELDEARFQQRSHQSEHKGCRPGHIPCRAGDHWAEQVRQAQVRLGSTRFLNEED
jgi:hypothetical protein